MAATFPIYINDRVRIVDNPIQWIVQTLRGKRWDDRMFYINRDCLTRRLAEEFGAISEEAASALASLPLIHPIKPDLKQARARCEDEKLVA
ncbi:hypothetical protein [Azospirillum sp. SYSU D00513]|uniref:hypothetical protein n=1 Tax=Azospirillum sp. SYSU D00513 TaxID=2812561 RepID=UPI001A96D9AF|nr:hypothetical protein [Azospirillum sp. SYSU D00513]